MMLALDWALVPGEAVCVWLSFILPMSVLGRSGVGCLGRARAIEELVIRSVCWDWLASMQVTTRHRRCRRSEELQAGPQLVVRPWSLEFGGHGGGIAAIERIAETDQMD